MLIISLCSGTRRPMEGKKRRGEGGTRARTGGREENEGTVEEEGGDEERKRNLDKTGKSREIHEKKIGKVAEWRGEETEGGRGLAATPQTYGSANA